jgi:hypothetical protein
MRRHKAPQWACREQSGAVRASLRKDSNLHQPMEARTCCPVPLLASRCAPSTCHSVASTPRAHPDPVVCFVGRHCNRRSYKRTARLTRRGRAAAANLQTFQHCCAHESPPASGHRTRASHPGTSVLAGHRARTARYSPARTRRARAERPRRPGPAWQASHAPVTGARSPARPGRQPCCPGRHDTLPRPSAFRHLGPDGSVLGRPPRIAATIPSRPVLLNPRPPAPPRRAPASGCRAQSPQAPSPSPPCAASWARCPR